MQQIVRTRFAPSPTGHLHIGNARTAILNWLFSRHSGGVFIVRVEDTDEERSKAASEAAILKDLRWLGLDWDEGPGADGPYGPYRQSERRDIYSDCISRLLQEQKAYSCYCTAEELDTRREERLKRGESSNYDGCCRGLSDSQRRQHEAEGRQPVIRFRSDAERSVTFTDLIRGEVEFPGSNIGDFVIARQNGMPMYNFCCTVDDHCMKITHVIRGDDHVSNTPRQVLLYQAFGWEVPVFGHSPMILGENRERLSKRHGAVSVSQYRQAGYLPEALVNFLSLLSWSSETGDELLSRERLIEEFDFGRVSKSAAVFDTVKLNWMNGMYIRQLAPNVLGDMLQPFLAAADMDMENRSRRTALAALFSEKIETLSDITEKAAFLFADRVEPENPEAAELAAAPEALSVIAAFLRLGSTRDTLDGAAFREIMKAVQQETGIKGKLLWMPVRIALTGMMHGPDLAGTIEFLGRETCLSRLEHALKRPGGGPSGTA